MVKVGYCAARQRDRLICVKRLSLALLPIALLACDPRGSAPTSLVVVTIDTLRADHLGAYGYFRDTSPNFDSLAQEGVLFEQAVSPMATTLPAHVSLWTGRFPLQTGVTRNGLKLREMREEGRDVRLFAEMLAEAGYETAAFVSAVPVTRKTGIDLGFATFDEPEGRLGRDRRRPSGRSTGWRWDRRSRSSSGSITSTRTTRTTRRRPGRPSSPGRGADGVSSPAFLDPTNEQVLDDNDGYDGEIALVDEELGASRRRAARHAGVGTARPRRHVGPR